MQIKLFLPALCVALAACSASAEPTTYVGVMVDNHEDARPYQTGLERAPFVQEQLMEGFITRFLAVFDVRDLPESVGPVRSLRPYFMDGTSPLLPAIFHAGGSPEALTKIAESETVTSFNALRLDTDFTYDDVAPAPHNRFLEKEKLTELLSRIPLPSPITLPFSFTEDFAPGESAGNISIVYGSRIHNVQYTYNAETESYDKESGGEARPPSPQNLVILETDVKVAGDYGRLSVRMTGSGKLLFFRDGGMTKGTWSKANEQNFFRLMDATGKELMYHPGQIWMIVLDDLSRVTVE